MNAPQYKPGGAEWPKVEAIITECSVSRLRAVNALKAAKNDQAAAIASLKDSSSLAKPYAGLLVGKPAESLYVDDGSKFPSSNSSQPLRLGGSRPPTSTTQFASELDSTPIPAPAVPASKQSFNGQSILEGKPKSKVPPIKPSSDVEPEMESVTWQPNTSKFRSPAEDKRYGPERRTAPEDEPAPLPPTNIVIPSPNAPRWDFRLPNVILDSWEPDFNAEEGLTKAFSIRRVISALQTGMKRGKLQHYLAFFSESVVAQHMNALVSGFPAIFYAVATNNEKIVRAWISNGGDVNVVDDTFGIPLLAYSIMMADTLGTHTTAVTTTLLSLGADVRSIPRVFFTPYLDDPPTKSPFNHRYPEFNEPSKQWCQDYMRPVLARTVNLSQRYFLEKTLVEKRPSERQSQVAMTHNATALLGIGYFMVGQSSAAKMVTQKSLSQMALPRSKPLVMVFSGPSGHGKTELARRMGELLSLELECIDCTEMKYETDLFGPKKPFIGHEAGSPLNNFLTRLSGRRCIVFLDEFEKTTKEVWNSLLIPFDEGKYTDRRNRQAVDVSKTIWIMATNALDDTILDFCDTNSEGLHDTSDAHRHKELMEELSNKLKKQLKSTFGNPLSGRVSLVVPFLPFSPGEQAVVAHKYVLDLQSKVRQSIQVSGSQLVGKIILHVKQDGAICKLIAEEGYDSEQGARSLKAAVESRIEDELVMKYLDEEGRIEDHQEMVSYTVDMSRSGILSVFKSHRLES